MSTPAVRDRTKEKTFPKDGSEHSRRRVRGLCLRAPVRAPRLNVGFKDLELGSEFRNTTVPFFTRDEATRIIEAAKEPYKTLFAVAWGTGMRAGEILALTRNDLDFERKTIRVNKSSDDKTREIRQSKTRNSVVLLPLSSQLEARLRDYLEHAWRPNPQGLLFQTVRATDRGNGNQLCSTR